MISLDISHYLIFNIKFALLDIALIVYTAKPTFLQLLRKCKFIAKEDLMNNMLKKKILNIIKFLKLYV